VEVTAFGVNPTKVKEPIIRFASEIMVSGKDQLESLPDKQGLEHLSQTSKNLQVPMKEKRLSQNFTPNGIDIFSKNFG
jgi:hypothetical protein